MFFRAVTGSVTLCHGYNSRYAVRSARPYTALRHVYHPPACAISAVKATTSRSQSTKNSSGSAWIWSPVTDHDSIDAVEALRSRPDFFLSEEVTCTLPSGTQLHIGVYDITERDHIEMQRRRDDFESLFAWLWITTCSSAPITSSPA